MNPQHSNERAGRNGPPQRSRPAKVMLFCDTFNVGGTERQLVQSLRLLDRSKYQLLAGCIDRRGRFLAEIEAMGIPVFGWPIPSLGSLRTLGQMLKLAGFLRRERIDVVHTFDYYTNMLVVPAARLAGVPVVLASRRNLARNRNFFTRTALGLICRMAHGTVANSAMAGRIAAGPAKKVHVIHNSIDPDAYSTEPPSLHRRRSLGVQDMEEQEKWVGVLARLRPEKGHRTFLQAAARVYAALPKARFVLIGDGPEQAALESLARELGIAGRVLFAGDCPDVRDWLAVLDLAVQPSNEESLPNAVLEAMASGRAVVATRVGGTPELIEEGVNGYLVPAADPEAMAARVVELLESDALRLRMGRAGRARVEREFTPAVCRMKLEALYDRLLGPGLGVPTGDRVSDGQTQSAVEISSKWP